MEFELFQTCPLEKESVPAYVVGHQVYSGGKALQFANQLGAPPECSLASIVPMPLEHLCIDALRGFACPDVAPSSRHKRPKPNRRLVKALPTSIEYFYRLISGPCQRSYSVHGAWVYC